MLRKAAPGDRSSREGLGVILRFDATIGRISGPEQGALYAAWRAGDQAAGRRLKEAAVHIGIRFALRSAWVPESVDMLEMVDLTVASALEGLSRWKPPEPLARFLGLHLLFQIERQVLELTTGLHVPVRLWHVLYRAGRRQGASGVGDIDCGALPARWRTEGRRLQRMVQAAPLGVAANLPWAGWELEVDRLSAELECRRLRSEVSARQWRVLALRAGADGTKRTLQECSQLLGVSRTRVRHLELTARNRCQLQASAGSRRADQADRPPEVHRPVKGPAGRTRGAHHIPGHPGQPLAAHLGIG